MMVWDSYILILILTLVGYGIFRFEIIVAWR